MFVAALSVLFSFVCSILSLMLIHDGPVLVQAGLLVSLLQHDVFLCYDMCLCLFLAGMP